VQGVQGRLLDLWEQVDDRHDRFIFILMWFVLRDDSRLNLFARNIAIAAEAPR
jgi:hypothetical protein